MMKRRHQFVITVTFDKPCTKAEALLEVKDCIHGEFFTSAWDGRERFPQEFVVKGFRRLKGGEK